MEYHQKVTNFLKKHHLYEENMFNYFLHNTTMIDYNNEINRLFIGCFYNTKDNILTNIHLTVPYVYDDITTLINIHELVHAIYLYGYLNKPLEEDIIVEALPILYEKLYITETNNEDLTKYGEYLDSIIDINNPKYAFALNNRNILLDNYTKDFNQMTKLTKKLAKTSKK